MVRIRRFAAALAAAAALTGAPAHAQVLQRLTVQSFVLGADTEHPQVDAPFHLIVTLRVREKIGTITNLELPVLAQLALLGDERRLQTASNGTTYRESITVVAHQPGTLTIGSAVLQAIDARDGRAKQYATNGLTLVVTGTSAPVAGAENAAEDALTLFLHVMFWAGGIACAVVLVVLLFRRRAKPVSLAPPAPTPAPPHPGGGVIEARSPQDELRDALTVLRAEPTRATAVQVREVVWRMVGASGGETLGDVLLRPQAANPKMRALLISLERAAFTYDGDLAPAIDDACATLERYLA